MDEVEALEGVVALDRAVHVHAARRCRRGAGSAPSFVHDPACRHSRRRSPCHAETTATIEKFAPSGFQHLVQPQAWLWAI